MNKNVINWAIFTALSFIWGSSFVLMQEGLIALNSFQVASLRILFSGIVLLPSAIRSFRKIPRNKLFIVFMSGVLGSLLPAFLFCAAEEKIDGALTGTLNALTPIFVIIVGALFFKSDTSLKKILGIGIAVVGSILLLLSKGTLQNGNLLYVFYVVIATLCYGINVNMVHKNLSGIPSLNIAAAALTLNAVPALLVLYFTGYFQLQFTHAVIVSSAYSALLGIMGTSLASILFYMLVKRAGTVFSSMVTYGIPVVANFWGIAYGDDVGVQQFICLAIILSGVFVANLKTGRGAEDNEQ